MAEKSDNRRLPQNDFSTSFMNVIDEQPREFDGRNGSPDAQFQKHQLWIGPLNMNASDCFHAVFYTEENQQCQKLVISNAALGNSYGFVEQIPPLPSYSEFYASTSSCTNQYRRHGRNDDRYQSYFTQHASQTE